MREPSGPLGGQVFGPLGIREQEPGCKERGDLPFPRRCSRISGPRFPLSAEPHLGLCLCYFLGLEKATLEKRPQLSPPGSLCAPSPCWCGRCPSWSAMSYTLALPGQYPGHLSSPPASTRSKHCVCLLPTGPGPQLHTPTHAPGPGPRPSPALHSHS